MSEVQTTVEPTDNWWEVNPPHNQLRVMIIPNDGMEADLQKLLRTMMDDEALHTSFSGAKVSDRLPYAIISATPQFLTALIESGVVFDIVEEIEMEGF